MATTSRYSDEIDITSAITSYPHARSSTPRPKNTAVREQVQDFDDKDKLLTIVAPTCSGAVLIICICAIVTYFMMRRKNKSKSVMMEPESKALMVDVPSYLADPVEMRRQHYQTPGNEYMLLNTHKYIFVIYLYFDYNLCCFQNHCMHISSILSK